MDTLIDFSKLPPEIQEVCLLILTPSDPYEAYTNIGNTLYQKFFKQVNVSPYCYTVADVNRLVAEQFERDCKNALGTNIASPSYSDFENGIIKGRIDAERSLRLNGFKKEPK